MFNKLTLTGSTNFDNSYESNIAHISYLMFRENIDQPKRKTSSLLILKLMNWIQQWLQMCDIKFS